MEVGEHKNFTIRDKVYELLILNMTIDTTSNCELFNSCKKTKYASQVTAMNNAIGFTSFQGTEAYQKSPVFIQMKYEKDKGLKFDNDKCGMDLTGKKIHRGYTVEGNCACNACEEKCVYDADVNRMEIMEGFNALTVALVYVFVILVSVVIYLLKKRGKSERRASEVSSLSLNEEGSAHDRLNQIGN